MDYSPAYVMELTRLSPETFRHWRKVLPPLARRKGRKRFSVGDILAILVLKEITSIFCIQIKGFAPVAERLFDICNVLNWESYKDKIMSINFEDLTIDFVNRNTMVSEIPAPLILVDISKHITRLKSKLLGESTSDQLEMHFPPRLVTRRAT